MADYDPNLRGIGGWLAFFLVTLGIISPLVFLVTGYQALSDPQMAIAYGDAWPALRTGEIVLIATIVSSCWFACWRFLNVFNWTTVKIGVGALWTLAVLGVLGEALLVSQLAGVGVGEVLAASGPDSVRPFVYATIWSAYLLRSQRVRNTYGETQGEAVGEVFE